MTTDITELAQSLKAAAEKYKSVWGIARYSKAVEAREKFHELVTPSNVIALVEAMEKAQRRIVELDRKNCELDSLTQRWAVELAENADHIAELESRTVTIEPFRSFVTDADLAALHRFAECCDDPESGGHDLEKEQVRRLEAIGALQRSGRISYITSFGDVLISITAGIKVETE